MAITKDHAVLAGIALSVIASGAALVRSGPATAPVAAVASGPAPLVAPPPPDHCAEACKALDRGGCVAGGSVNCAALLKRYEQADGGPHFSCAEPITRAWLDSVNWCPGWKP